MSLSVETATPQKQSFSALRRRKGTPLVRALPWLFPAIVLYGYFLIHPMLDSIRLAFFNWSGFRTEDPVFVGLSNFHRMLFNDPVFWKSTGNSVIWMVLTLLVPTVISLLLALGLNERVFGRNLFRSVFYLPAVFASITVAAMWRWIYNPTLGIVNTFLREVGLGDWTQEWLGNPDIALYSVFVASIWQGVGFNMVLFLAGLQQVPRELVEAARIDGANALQVFRNVTIPALKPTLTVVIILTIIGSLKVFDLVVGMTSGGPAQSTQVLALWSYTQSFANRNFGQGGAVATVLLLVTLVIVIPYLLWAMKDEEA